MAKKTFQSAGILNALYSKASDGILAEAKSIYDKDYDADGKLLDAINAAHRDKITALETKVTPDTTTSNDPFSYLQANGTWTSPVGPKGVFTIDTLNAIRYSTKNPNIGALYMLNYGNENIGMTRNEGISFYSKPYVIYSVYAKSVIISNGLLLYKTGDENFNKDELRRFVGYATADSITWKELPLEKYVLPTATDEKLGGIKIGTGFSVLDGKISIKTMTTNKAGLVPAPTNDDSYKFLRGDGTWKNPIVPSERISLSTLNVSSTLTPKLKDTNTTYYLSKDNSTTNIQMLGIIHYDGNNDIINNLVCTVTSQQVKLSNGTLVYDENTGLKKFIGIVNGSVVEWTEMVVDLTEIETITNQLTTINNKITTINNKITTINNSISTDTVTNSYIYGSDGNLCSLGYTAQGPKLSGKSGTKYTNNYSYSFLPMECRSNAPLIKVEEGTTSSYWSLLRANIPKKEDSSVTFTIPGQSLTNIAGKSFVTEAYTPIKFTSMVDNNNEGTITVELNPLLSNSNYFTINLKYTAINVVIYNLNEMPNNSKITIDILTPNTLNNPIAIKMLIGSTTYSGTFPKKSSTYDNVRTINIYKVDNEYYVNMQNAI